MLTYNKIIPESEKPQFEGEIGQVNTLEGSSEQPKEELTPEKLREMMCDPNFLPTREQIMKAFTDWGQWYEFCFKEDDPVFEFFNKEYLSAFADYLVGRIQEYGASKEKPLIVLEIGAGNRRLSYFLRQELEERAPGQIKIIATDSGERGLKSYFPVEKLDHNKAMEKYSPDIVVFSWMPYQQDCTKDIRECASVKEYILIGETDGGCCGDEWETWGYSWSFDEKEMEARRDMLPPYEADGFQRKDLDDLSCLQICRNDEPGRYYHSRTVSFKRIK